MIRATGGTPKTSFPCRLSSPAAVSTSRNHMAGALWLLDFLVATS